MAENKDYYQILGISKTASQDEIKQAYKKLAKEHHPDMVRDGKKDAAEKRFKEINEAYQILSDTQKRKMYDQYGSAATGPGGFGGAGAGAGPFGGSGGFGGAQQGQWGPFSYSYTSGQPGGGSPFGANQDFDPMDVFEEFFGFRGFGGQRAPKKGKNLYYEMTVEFADAVHGAEKEINIESGKMKIRIPSGARDGTELRFAGKGNPGPNNLPAGDLFITLRVHVPREFEISGDTVVMGADVGLVDAVIGGAIEIPVIDVDSTSGIGRTKLDIPAGTQHGTRLIVRGKGMPKLGGKGQGDVVVQVFVVVPKKVSKRQRELLEEFRRVG